MYALIDVPPSSGYTQVMTIVSPIKVVVGGAGVAGI